MRLTWAISVMAVAVRVVLGLSTQEANDDHVEVVLWLLRTGKIPMREDCLECYHAKIYHICVADLCRFLGVNGRADVTLVANLLSVAAATGWIYLLARVVRPWRAPIFQLVFAFIVSWPAFVAIQSQATNDSFIILFGTLSGLAFVELYRRPDLKGAFFLGLSLSVAALSKASGWVLWMTSLSAMASLAWGSWQQRRPYRAWLKYLVLICVLFLGFVPTANPYANYIRQFGHPFVGSSWEYVVPPRPRAEWFRETECRFPGVRTISEGFGTFPFFGMLREPFISGGSVPAPFHRTSFWAQVYGRLFSLRFDQWPRSWKSLDRSTLMLGRIGLILGLLPSLWFGIGLWRRLVCFWRATRMYGISKTLTRTGRLWIPQVFFGSLVAMLIYIAIVYRNYFWIKPIYVFPAVFGAFSALISGVLWSYRKFPRAVAIALSVLILFNWIDTVGLIAFLRTH